MFIDKASIAIIPVRTCNLACDFCDSNNMTMTTQQLHNEISQTFENAYKVMATVSRMRLELFLQGGELFQKKIPLKMYYNFFEKVVKQYNIEKINITTNLMTSNIVDIVKLVNKFNIQLVTSFDFEGRFKNSKAERLWFNNFQYCVKNCIKIPSVSIVGHKKNYQAVMSQKHQYHDHFLYITKTSAYGFESYSDIGLEEFRVSENLKKKFYQFLLTNYPTECKIQEAMSSNGMPHCRTCEYEVYYDRIILNCDGCNKHHEAARFITKHQCFACQYMTKCSMECYRDDECYKWLYELIDNKGL